MLTCLLCQRPLQSQIRLLSIVLLKSPQSGCCSDCQANFQLISGPHCPSCYKMGQEEVCQDCQFWQRQGDQVQHQSLYRYNSAMKAYFAQYKFQGDYLLRLLFAPVLAKALRNYSDYTLVPIPVSAATYQVRGFNQVCGWLDSAKLPYKLYLSKADSVKQSSLDRQARLQMKQVFSMVGKLEKDEKILLLDDIYTTGSTLRQARLCLLKAGAKDIKTFSLAR